MHGKVNPISLKLAYAPLAVLMMISIACHADNMELLTRIEHKGVAFTLTNDNGGGVIQVGASNKHRLDIPWPCGFVRSDKKMVAQTQYYEGVGQVFIIAGPPADKSEYHQNAGVIPDNICSNHGQAVIYQKDKLTPRKAANIPLGFCHQLGFDEKDYYGYAYPVE